MQKIKIGHQAKFRAKSKMFSVDFISGLHNFMQHLTSNELILIHSADPCFLVMACLDCVCMIVQLKTLSSLLKDTITMGANALHLSICMLLKLTVNTAQN